MNQIVYLLSSAIVLFLFILLVSISQIYFWKLFPVEMMAKGKAYKIRNLSGIKKFGVVADSVDILLVKASKKLCLKVWCG